MLEGNAVVAQSGGPTAVINQSLVGVVERWRDLSGGKGRVFGARHGVRGMIEDKFVDLTETPAETLEAVAGTPSAALGSSRDKPDESYCQKIIAALKARDIRNFFYIGGNDSSDTCRIVDELSRKSGYAMRCFHVPKTVDNDLMENDHTPGYASAARYVALAFMGDNLDNASLPGIKINVVMGRHAGFLTGAAALSKQREEDGPHLVYLPEVAFDLDRFVSDIEGVYRKHKRCQIAVSEGIQDSKGQAIAATLTSGEKDAHGNVQLSGSGALGDMLAEFIKKRLTPAGGKPPRVRADTLGYPQRCWPDPSKIDQCEARGVGRFAVEQAHSGFANGSIAIERVKTSPYESRMKRVELTAVAAKTRHMPAEFIEGHRGVSKAFIEWLTPLVGELPRVGRL